MTDTTTGFVTLGDEPGHITTGLTEGQRKEVIDLLHVYLGSDQAKSLAQNAARDEVFRNFDASMQARIAVCVAADPAKSLEQLFRQSGMVVKTEASKVFDAIVADLLKDEDSGVPAAIRQYVADHLPELVQRAVGEIVTAMVMDFLKSGASAAAQANVEMIRDAFMRARVSPGY